MKATKENKVYSIAEEQKQFYIDGGFDILDDGGGVIAYGKGKTISYAEYMAVKEELEQLKENSDQEKKEQLEKLQKELEEMKTVDADVFAIISAYCSEHAIDIGRVSTVSGAMKKIAESKGTGSGQ